MSSLSPDTRRPIRQGEADARWMGTRTPLWLAALVGWSSSMMVEIEERRAPGSCVERWESASGKKVSSDVAERVRETLLLPLFFLC
jgi:hypothetical protein